MTEIKFKNGSVIKSLDQSEGVRGYRSSFIYYGKPTLKDRWKDFVLKIKNLLR